MRINDEVEGILSLTMKTKIDIDRSVVIPREIFSSRRSLIDGELNQ